MRKSLLCILALVTAAPAWAQDMPGMDMSKGDMAGMKMSGMKMSGTGMNGALGNYSMTREASGTSWQPDAAPMTGVMEMSGNWMVMLQGRVAGILDSQSGPRGASMAYESGMGMAMATDTLSENDTLGLRAMFSLDPFIGRRGYPLLLASGETANGVTPLIDRQHPHDLLMELAATYSHNFSATDSVYLYGGDPGEPALGPTAYMHRLSGMDDPATPIAHHWLDSTHITFGVATLGVIHDDWKLEASQFTGREPDQFRFNFDPVRLDSSAVRLSYNPDPNWSLQISQGFLKSPEQLTPSQNENRVTASATYFNQFGFGSLATTLAFGNKRLTGGVNESGALLESEFKPDDVWTVFARGESIGSDELVPEPGVRRAGEVTLGVIHDWRVRDHLKIGLGGLYSFDFAPASALAPYGADPHGAMTFLRLVVD